LGASFEIIKDDDVAYDELFNLLVYESIREKLLEDNDMLIIVLIE
jgi:hypothetical protein